MTHQCVRKDSVTRLSVNVLPLLLGILAFFIVIGPRALNPQNIAWLGSGDPATHYLGWVFFRHSPWSLPLGLNPSYGLELSSAIIYSDSNPLLALIFKPFAAWLPEPFQYFGLWLLLCFVLQGWFAWKLMGLATANIALRLLGAALFLFNPALISRMGEHLSLAGHFLILAALYLALRPHAERRCLAWGSLLAVAALIHAYLLAMVGLIWLADLLARSLRRQLLLKRSFVELVGLLLLTGVCCWQAGYFTVEGEGLASFGFGLFRANVLTFFDPAGWSRVLGDIPGVPGDSAGMAFPGLGVMFLLVCALWFICSGEGQIVATMRKRWLLLLALSGLMLFAFSNRIGVGPLEFVYWLPDPVISMAGIFRASGRMIWPVMYAAIFAVVFLIARNAAPRTALLLLVTALLVQVFDTRAGWAGIRRQQMVTPAATWKTQMVNPFWQSAAAHYQKVRYVIPQNLTAHWMTLSDYAGRNHLATDAVYLGRVSAQAQEDLQRTAGRTIDSGKYERDTLYVLEQRSALQAALNVDDDSDMLARIDGFHVLAPGWKRCADCLPLMAGASRDLIPSFDAGEKLQFVEGSRGTAALGKGWWFAEAWGTGSVGPDAEIILRPKAGVSSLTLETNAFLSEKTPRQTVDISINNVPVISASLTNATSNAININLPAEVQALVAQQGVLRIQLHFPLAVSPHDLGWGEDIRKLAIGLLALTFH
ncbi:hypothetical protein HUW52_01085 [Pseudomonas sp. 43A]|uniref:DUF6311 domain-containing protein n=1 Tax=unclassified Pseudomonas TaxID=196821 RepID=UPI001587B7D3|nr:DUF6311 domain-containing protein [Pseudomonas sp. 43A]QKV61525.1 hypothetical protein HUW52_01085 [Pseudomonas sp. 43A]QMW10261.1 hypothetical protein H3303_01085 [Pseudomonas sp. 29A]